MMLMMLMMLNVDDRQNDAEAAADADKADVNSLQARPPSACLLHCRVQRIGQR